MMKIAITTSSFASYDDGPLKALRAQSIDYVLNPHGRKVTPSELLELAAGVDGIIAGTESLDRNVLSRMPQLRVISRLGAGLDNVDQEAARERGITVCSTPFGPTLAVAELTMGLILDMLRRITAMDRELRSGVWKKRMGNLLAGKKVGIVGFGRIGRKLAELLEPFGAQVAYCDPLAPAGDNRSKDMRALLAWGDIVTLHCPARPDGSPLIGDKEIRCMRDGAWLINASRGGLVDEAALYSALKEGRLTGAAVDTFENEPYSGPLAELDTVILTPHVGSYAREGRVQMEIDAVKNLIAAFEDL